MLSPKVCLSGLSYVCILERPAPELQESRHPTIWLSFDAPPLLPVPQTPLPHSLVLRPPGLRAGETAHAHSGHTCRCTRCPQSLPVLYLYLAATRRAWCEPVLQHSNEVSSRRRSERREPEEGSSIYIRNISLFWCSFCKCCIPDYLLGRAQCSVPR